jgi:uncharacterized integral membrane protein (TIGR00698 family)
MTEPRAGGPPRVVSAGVVVAGAALACWPAVSGAQALVLGVVLGLLGANAWSAVTKPLATRMLQGSVIGLGAGINLAVIWSVGVSGIGYTMAGIGFTFALGLWLGRRAGLPRDLSILLTSGTAICGGSAIAAVAGVLKPRPEETTVALATVFMLNAVALVLFPPLGHALGLGQHQFGLWAALAIHDTSSVVGAAAGYGEEALKVATTVKLARALWIAPLALAIGWAVRRFAHEEGKTAGRVAVPWFIFGFLAVAAVVSAVPSLAEPGRTVFAVAKRSLVVTLFLIGANLSRGALKVVGWRPLLVGVALWLGVSMATVGAILAGWIR